MPQTYGNNRNRGYRSTTFTDVPAVAPFIRPEQGEKTTLRVARWKTPLSMPFVVFLALQAAFFGCVAWTRISAPGVQKALASSADASVPLRVADSKTIGTDLAPTLVQEVLQRLGTADAHVRNRVSAKEHRVSSSLPESTSRAVIAIPPPGSASPSSGLTATNHSVGTAHDPVGQTIAEEIHPPVVSEALGAIADYGKVPAWVVEAPVPMPGEPPRISSGVSGGEIVHRVTPIYPPQARTQRIQGDVVLEARVGEDGTVSRVTVLSGGPSSLANSAREAVRQWRYTPPELNGKPTPMLKQITIKFTLPSK